MTDWIFATPLWTFLLLLIAAGTLLYVGNNRQDKVLLRIGGAAMLLAVVLGLLSYFFDTDKETVLKRSKLLVAAVNQKDWNAFGGYLDPRVSFNDYGDRESLTNGAKMTAESIGLKDVSVSGTEIVKNGGAWTVSMTVFSTQDVTMGQSFPTNWQFDWQDTGQGWLVYSIKPLDSKFVTAEVIKGKLVGNKR